MVQHSTIVTDSTGAISHVLMTSDEYARTDRWLRRAINGRPHLLVTCSVNGRVDVPVHLTGGSFQAHAAPRRAARRLTSVRPADRGLHLLAA